MNKLPEKWAIRGNYKIAHIIKQYFKSINKDNHDWRFCYDNFYSNDINNAMSFSFLPAGYTEISFETFERLVLKINKTKTYELW